MVSIFLYILGILFSTKGPIKFYCVILAEYATNLGFVYELFQIILEIICVFVLYLLLIIVLLVRVAFVTLMEQKILGAVQIRFGPTKVGYWGVLQPFADAVKLFCKEIRLPWGVNMFYFYIGPFIRIFVVLFL